MTEPIKGFRDQFSFLSNFHLCTITWKGYTFTNSEAIYACEKCGGTPELLKQFSTLSPNDSKKLGRKLPMLPNWDAQKYTVMLAILREKFAQNQSLRDKLIATGNVYIEETNYWKDHDWGVCNGIGQNNLGKLLMQVRLELTPNTTNTILAVTGHRPQKLYNGGDLWSTRGQNYKQLVQFCCQHIIPMSQAKFGTLEFYLGMALGFDQAMADACIITGMPWRAAIPFEGQERKWSDDAIKYYKWLLAQAPKTEIVIKDPSPILKTNTTQAKQLAGEYLFKRDEYMVDNSMATIALWNTIPSGGTYHTVDYTKKQGKKVFNFWPLWEPFRPK